VSKGKLKAKEKSSLQLLLLLLREKNLVVASMEKIWRL